MDLDPKSSPDPGSPTGPSPKTLVSLLTDDSKATQQAVLKALTDLGDAAWPALAAAMDGEDPHLRARARRAQLQMQRKSGKRALRELLGSAGPDGGLPGGPGGGSPTGDQLISGLLAIDDILGFRPPAPSVSPGPKGAYQEPTLAQLARWIDQLNENDSWREGPPLAAAGALRRVLAGEARLTGTDEDFHNLQNVSLSRTIERRSGLPLTLCAIYAFVARGVGLEAWLLPFPGQVLLSLGPENERLVLDPFRGGSLVSPATALERLMDLGAPASTHWLNPSTDRTMLVRQTRNLSAAMTRHGRDRDAEYFDRLSSEFS